MVVCTRHTHVEYPFFEAARSLARGRPSPTFVAAFRNAGFACAGRGAYPPSSTGRRLGMMRNRFWSTFAGFSDGGSRRASPGRGGARTGPIAFEERVVFIAEVVDPWRLLDGVSARPASSESES